MFINKKFDKSLKGKKLSAVELFACHWADNSIIYQHRLSEWCGKAPTLEVEMSLANIALDHLGHGRMWLNVIVEELAKKKISVSEDELVYHRDSGYFRNFTLLELPNTDYAEAMMRLYLYVSFYDLVIKQVIQVNSVSEIKNVAEKVRVELLYHLRFVRHSIMIMINGTEESKSRIINALGYLLPYCNEFFFPEPYEKKLLGNFFPSTGKTEWTKQLLELLKPLPPAILQIKNNFSNHSENYLPKGKRCQHSEHLGYLLDELQSVRRKYEEVIW